MDHGYSLPRMRKECPLFAKLLQKIEEKVDASDASFCRRSLRESRRLAELDLEAKRREVYSHLITIDIIREVCDDHGTENDPWMDLQQRRVVATLKSQFHACLASQKLPLRPDAPPPSRANPSASFSSSSQPPSPSLREPFSFSSSSAALPVASSSSSAAPRPGTAAASPVESLLGPVDSALGLRGSDMEEASFRHMSYETKDALSQLHLHHVRCKHEAVLALVDGVVGQFALTSEGPAAYSAAGGGGGGRTAPLVRAALDCLGEKQQAADAALLSTIQSYSSAILHLSRSLDILVEYVQLKQGLQFQRDEAEVKVLSRLFDATAAKLRAIEQDVLAASYTPDTVAALRIIRRKLDEAASAQQERFDRAKAKLEQYLKLGPEMEKMAVEFQEVLEQRRKLAEIEDEIYRDGGIDS